MRTFGKIIGSVIGGFFILMAGVGVGMYPTESARDAGMKSLPKATMTITVPAPASLPEATTQTLPKATIKVPAEDDRGFDCRTQGNRICGPNAPGGHAAGCYRNNRLVIAWSNYRAPREDPLWAQMKSPC